MELGLTDAEFWPLTPRELQWLMEAATKREQRQAKHEQAQVALHMAHWGNITAGYMANVANLLGKKKGGGAFKARDFLPESGAWQPADFMPREGATAEARPEQKPAQDWQHMKRVLMGFTRALGGEVPDSVRNTEVSD